MVSEERWHESQSEVGSSLSVVGNTNCLTPCWSGKVECSIKESNLHLVDPPNTWDSRSRILSLARARSACAFFSCSAMSKNASTSFSLMVFCSIISPKIYTHHLSSHRVSTECYCMIVVDWHKNSIKVLWQPTPSLTDPIQNYYHGTANDKNSCKVSECYK